MSRLQLVVLIFSTCAALLALPSLQIWRQQAPDFHLYPAGEARKTAFFNYFGPIIEAQNARWLADRQRLLRLLDSQGSKRDELWLHALEKRYGVANAALLTHVDVIPRSLALAQAAKESAWGTSRFAVEGNSFFGQRCFEKGCGMIPAARQAGEIFEVKRFATARASVASYMNNINGHIQYQNLREYRAQQRHLGLALDGIKAAERLSQYSERRQAYVDEIQSLIHFNKLEDQ